MSTIVINIDFWCCSSKVHGVGWLLLGWFFCSCKSELIGCFPSCRCFVHCVGMVFYSYWNVGSHVGFHDLGAADILHMMKWLLSKCCLVLVKIYHVLAWSVLLWYLLISKNYLLSSNVRPSLWYVIALNILFWWDHDHG